MSSASPTDQYGSRSGGNGSADVSGQSDNGKSPLSMSLGFLKTLTEKKGTRVDGQPPKRRGPKPDSKPALTRRQELNRQAQRTHRERKELYITALEQEVLRLKENFSTVARDKEAMAEENRQLKHLLVQHGIPWPGVSDVVEHSSPGYTSSASISTSYGPGSTSYSPPPQTTHQFNASASPPTDGRSMAQLQAQRGIDHDQEGINFVLALERNCMDHMDYLVQRSCEEGGEPCGHALMASCPPDPFPDTRPDVPFGHTAIHTDGVHTQRTWDLSKSDLTLLLDLGRNLYLDGQITPIMAWGIVLAHEKFPDIRDVDFEFLRAELVPKIRCFGWGAVLEEFELRDTLELLFFTQHMRPCPEGEWEESPVLYPADTIMT